MLLAVRFDILHTDMATKLYSKSFDFQIIGFIRRQWFIIIHLHLFRHFLLNAQFNEIFKHNQNFLVAIDVLFRHEILVSYHARIFGVNPMRYTFQSLQILWLVVGIKKRYRVSTVLFQQV